MPVIDYYQKERYIKKYQHKGPLTDYFDSFADWLQENKYHSKLIKIDLTNISHFNFYLSEKNCTDFVDIKKSYAEDFVQKHIPGCRCHWWGQIRNKKKVILSIARFSKYLIEVHSINVFEEHSELQNICINYKTWLSTEKNCSSKACCSYPRFINNFLLWYNKVQGKSLSDISLSDVELFLIKKDEKHKLGTKYSVTILRSFFKFCYQKQIVSSPLFLSIQGKMTRRLSGLPRGIQDNEAIKYLSLIDRETRYGKRLYAMVLLLYTYGVRGVQIRNLMFSDINWNKNEINFAAVKGGKESRFNLTGNAGNAIIDYIQNARPNEERFKNVFLTFNAPIKPVTSTLFNYIISESMKKDNITSPVTGSHCFRHAFVSRLLNNGNSIKDIADFVGHRHIDTTFIYTKIDIISLKQVPLELLEGIV